MNDSVSEVSKIKCKPGVELNARTETLTYFFLTVVGFSFWFLMAVPFASHRETYSWLAGVRTGGLAQQFSFGLSSTYRPLAQIVTWFGFLVLNPSEFPTNVVRQAFLQGFVYGMFLIGWWLIYSAVRERRLFAVVACLTGAIFFSGYIQLFHLYGMFYVPVILMLGALLRFQASNTFLKREIWFAVAASALIFWHPFATALFVGFFAGFYLDSFRQRTRSQHIQAITILSTAIMAIVVFVILFPRAKMPLDTKLSGFLISYQTNEVNHIASLAAFLLTQLSIFSMRLSFRVKLVVCLVVIVVSLVLFTNGLPLLLLWMSAALIKMLSLRDWSLFFLMLTAMLLPFGGGIGTPVYALFAIILAAYATSLEWSQAESMLSFLKTRYVMGIITALAVIVLMIRAGIQVPIVTRLATPLLAERERTYQLENILEWLHNSEYCGCQLAFLDKAGSPIDDVASVMNRWNRPPASLGDVQLYWNTVLRCNKSMHSEDYSETVIVTFGGMQLPNSKAAFEAIGKYAGKATAWTANVKQ